ncbi:glycosyltransferase [Methylocella silvestris]|uniref:Glycosyl transferase family 2 n=1 Tax=Methylocella silvestris TaxID=199596 RepID=A0A2J7TER0_METSI|nr:glycosyltransferase [Methylocella silvestris]PNG25251.1 glycosyl transferase family 2 [Methylocella silvestris]
MRFNIVTSVFNGEAFLNETILSVASQAGDFSIRYHIQDAGSTDSTLKLLEGWQKRFEQGFPLVCSGLDFTFSSERDNGIYDGLNKGFAQCGAADAMTWINADDRFEPGAFSTVATIFRSDPDVEWLSGRQTVLAESGENLYMSPLIPLPRKAVAAGIFDGRSVVSFIQQEGTFWRPRLWEKVGGLNASFRLAGDFDLWRRFAREAPLVSVDAILGCFRTRSGQLSADRASYYAELDASMTEADRIARKKAARLYKLKGYTYPVMVRHYGGPWVCECWPMSVMTFLGGRGFKLEHWRLQVARLLGLAD